MADRDSSSSLSSPGPDSPPNQNSGVPFQSDEIRVAVARSGIAGGVAPHPADTAASATTAAAPKKRTRKPKEPKTEGEEKEKPAKKPRKPREPKVKNEDGSVPAPQRKRAKAATDTQKTLDQMVTQFQTPGLPASAPQQQSYPPLVLPSQPQHPTDTVTRDSLPPPASKTPTPRPYSSGQNYDPIRGATIDAAPPPRAVATTNGVHSAHASPHINRASASPSITSLIDPPPAMKPSIPPLSFSSQAITQQQTHAPQPLPPFIGSAQHSPTPPRASLSSSTLPSQPALVQQPPNPIPQQPSIPNMDGAMDIDAPPKQPGLEVKQSKSSSSAPTPQLQKEKKTASSPKAAGTGLLASSDLFGGPGAKQNVEPRGVNIDIKIPLNPSGGNAINMAQEIAKKYGRDAINPRAAAHRERLLQVAAAANRLEGGSADDISVDLMSDNDDSNVEMGGMDDGGNTATGADDDKPKKKRKRKEEEYDKEDDFIDDTELAWEEKAAVAKDGFFVYSGPLVPEGQAAQVESSTTSGRGRGGGRGRGRGRGANAAANANGRADAEKTKDPNAPTRGRGSRGGRTVGATRKPRVTKAMRETMEMEKAERERIAKQINPPALQLAPTNTVTPPNLGQIAQQLPMQVSSNGYTVPA